MLGSTSRSNCRFNVIVNPRNPWPTYNSSCLWIVPEKILDCASSGLFCGGSSGLSFVLFVTLFLAVCSRKNSWLSASVLLSLFPLLMCRFVVIAEFPLGCLVERLTRLLSLLSSLIDLFVDRKLVPRDLWTVHLQVGSVGRSTDVILIKSVCFNLIFKGWNSDFFKQTDLLEISDVLWAIYRCFC